MKTRPTRIHLTKSGGSLLEEGIAAAAINPGELLAKDSDGKYIPHNVAGGPALTEFALEDALQGKTIEDAYAIGDRVFTCRPQRGEIIFARLAAGEVITKDDYLASNGDGTLKLASSTNTRIAQAHEAVDNSDTGAEDTFIKVAII